MVTGAHRALVAAQTQTHAGRRRGLLLFLLLRVQVHDLDCGRCGCLWLLHLLVVLLLTPTDYRCGECVSTLLVVAFLKNDVVVRRVVQRVVQRVVVVGR